MCITQMDDVVSLSCDATRNRLDDARRQDEKTARAQRPVVRHSRSSTRILKQWFTSHATWPYPDQAEKESLSCQSGMSVKQVANWFVNARRRNGAKLARGWLPSSSQPLPAVAQSAPVGLQAGGHVGLDDFHSRPWDSMTPLDRWQHTPPEQEPVSLQALAQAAQHASDMFPLGPGDAPLTEAYGVPPSWSSFDFSSSDSSSASSAYYHSSASDSASASSSFAKHGSLLRRRKRRREPKAVDRRFGQRNANQDRDARPYQCTFCTDTFKSRYDWTRHEGSLHLVLEKWTCLLLGPRRHDPAETNARCVLCNEPDPADAHLEWHRVAECIAKPPAARTFFRKDHLRQHLRLAHGVDKLTDSMETWRSKEANIRSRCGFCGETFTTWPDRNDHLADHFRAGAQMKDWKGCRGLDPSVALFVENAMPPYLIGVESADPEPFSASRGTTKKVMAPSGGEPGACRPAPTSFESLNARLGDYVRIARENRLDLSDEALRRQARLILYDGDDDPWNQTPADNTQWLAMFKLGHRLGVNASCRPDDQGQVGNLALGAVENGFGSACSAVGPFTVQTLQQAAGCDQAMLPFYLGAFSTDGTAAAMGGSGLAVPWSWQTPECLAEFSQLCQMPDSAGLPRQTGDVSGDPVPPVGHSEAAKQDTESGFTGIRQLVDDRSSETQLGDLDDAWWDMTTLFCPDSEIF